MRRLTMTMILACAAWIAAPESALAQQRPLVTEDPETIGLGRVLIEGGFELDKGQVYTASGVKADTTHLGTFGISVGVGPTAEIQVDGGLLQRLSVTERLTSHPPLPRSPELSPGDRTSSAEDFIVATKIRLAAETEARPAIGVRFGTKLPTADPEKGIGLGTTDFFASFLAGKTVQSVRTVGNVGLMFLGNPADGQDHARALSFGVSIARALTNEFEVVGEVNGRLSPFDEIVPPGLESRGALRFAGRYTYSLLRLDFGLLLGITNQDPNFGILAGATYVIAR